MVEKVNLFLFGHNAHTPVHNSKDLSLEKYLASMGWRIVKASQEADIILCIDATGNLLSSPTLPETIPDQPRILVLQEPEVVWPNNANKGFRESFDYVIEIGRPDGSARVPWPTKWPDDYSQYFAVNKLQSAVLIASNRLSFFDNELYSLRREIVRKVNSVSVYGRDWNLSLPHRVGKYCIEFTATLAKGKIPKLSRGRYFFTRNGGLVSEVADKFRINSMYKVSLVLENSTEYVSEKILEAILCGSIPVYVGSNPKAFGIPAELYVSTEAKVDSVLFSIDEALKMDYEVWKNRALSWLAESQAAKKWRLEQFWQDLDQLLRASIDKPLDRIRN
jgi:hypothetical protein